MAGVDNNPDHFVDIIFDIDHDHLRARNHDVAHLRLGYLEHAGEHALFLGIDGGFGLLDDVLDFFAAPGLTFEGTLQAREQRSGPWAAGTWRFVVHLTVVGWLAGLKPVSGQNIVSASCVRVGDAELVEDAPLECLHRLGLFLSDMVVAKQVQGTVHQHVGPVVLKRLALLIRLARHDAGADDDVTEQRCFTRRHEARVTRGKRQYVRRLVLIAVLPVQGAHLRFVDDAHGNLGTSLRIRGTHGAFDPALHGIDRRYAGGIAGKLHVYIHRTACDELDGIAVGLVGGNDALHERMPDDVLPREKGEADTIDTFQHSRGII